MKGAFPCVFGILAACAVLVGALLIGPSRVSWPPNRGKGGPIGVPPTQSKTSSGASSGTPELPRILMDTRYVPPAGRTIAVGAKDDFQAALNQARPGDLITLEAGATFVGNFVLPRKTGSEWLVIRSSAADASLPPEGTRSGPSYARAMPKVLSDDSRPAIAASAGAHHYRFIGIEIGVTDAAKRNNNVVLLGTGEETSVEQLPHDLVFDRCYVHGNATGNIRRGIAVNAASVAVIDSYISQIHEVGADSQAIGGWGSPGPLKIVNNYLEGSGENFMLGGAWPPLRVVTSDVEFRRNHVFKPLSWRVGDPSYAGIHWAVKNLFEFKNAQRVLVYGNVFENNWADGQNGIAVLFTPRSSDSGPQAVVQDVTFTYNIVRHASGGFNILGHDNLDPSIPGKLIQAQRIKIKDNLLTDINTSWGGDGRFVQLLLGAGAITIDHNTAFQNGNILTFTAPGWTFPNFVYQSNITPHNDYGVIGDGTGIGSPTLDAYAPGYVFVRNIIAAMPASQPYPKGNFFPRSWSKVRFANQAGGNYDLAASSPYRNAGTDGKDLGADITAINEATTGVLAAGSGASANQNRARYKKGSCIGSFSGRSGR